MIWKKTMELRTVHAGEQGLVGIQQMWRNETGESKWSWLPTTDIWAVQKSAESLAVLARGNGDDAHGNQAERVNLPMPQSSCKPPKHSQLKSKPAQD